MSKVYLEARETVAYGAEAETIRLDVTAKSQVERDAILVSLKDLMTGITATFTQHRCNHDTGGTCSSEVV